MNNQLNISDEIRKIVLFRIETLPSNRKISIGSYGDFTKEELITHIKNGDEIGKKMIEIELEFLRTFKEGIIQ